MTAQQTPPFGVLLANLGTPKAPTAAAVREYLAEFLWDQRVVDVPRPLWWLILNGIILRVRPGRVAKAYQSVWTEDGSPLMAISLRQQKALKELEAAQLKGNELNALIQRQTGAIRVLLDLKAEQSESLRQDVPNGEIETVLSE